MTINDLPATYLSLNDVASKNISIVVQIEGVPFYFSNTVLTQRISYGDPGLTYGEPGLFYGGMTTLPNSKDILSLDGSSLTISQVLEPEQGRGSVSTLTLCFIDKDGYMTQVISPGIIVDDIIGKTVRVYLGFQNTSFPDDYFIVFRGVITQYQYQSGRVTFQTSDPNVTRRQQVFFSAQTTLASDITNSQTTIPVVGNGDFHKQILGPNGTYDPAIRTFLKIGDEYIEYNTAGFGANTFTGVTRGVTSASLGVTLVNDPTAVAHSAGDGVKAWVLIEDNAIDMALKIMLSGWDGPWKTGVAIQSLGFISDPLIENPTQAIVFPDGVDVIRDYGLALGEYITISGATNGSNDVTVQITDIEALDSGTNQIVYTGHTFIPESTSPALLAFRSQYDTYPVSCGVSMTPDDVDIAEHVALKNTFLNQTEDTYRFLLDPPTTAKTFIESQIFLPSAAYSLTRQGRVSVGYTKPPLADQRFQILKSSDLLDPQNISPIRGTNNRKFFNNIQYTYDYDDQGGATNNVSQIDTNSLNIIGLQSVLPIDAQGARSDLGFNTIIDRRTKFLLNRYKDGALQITVKLNWKIGSQIEGGDVVAIDDTDNILQIPNFDTGQRGGMLQLFEVTNRQFDLKAGQVSLTLIGGIQANVGDRFATISPSSLIDSGSTTTNIRITESFGEIFPGAEQKKWTDYVGLPIIVHSHDWSYQQTVTFTGFDPAYDHGLLVSPALSGAPPAGYIVDIDRYPTSTDPLIEKLYKLVHCFLDPTVAVASGTSTTVFTVTSGAGTMFNVGAIIYVHNQSYSVLSPEVNVLNVVGDTITVDSSLGFTPTSSDFVDLIGFADLGEGYRFI